MRVNRQIRVKEIRLIGPKGEQEGVVPLEQGLKLAEDNQLDLVEVAPQVAPPVCRVMDYSKYKYEQKRKEREAHKHQKVIHLKEIKLSPKIEEHDIQVKLRHAERFFKRGDKVKITLRFRGREIVHPEFGRHLMDRFSKELSGLAEVEKGPMVEGRTILMIMVPK